MNTGTGFQWNGFTAPNDLNARCAPSSAQKADNQTKQKQQ